MKRPLDEYAAKRTFNRTPEPAPKQAAGARHGPLLFVVQKHAASRLHYDWRLELDGVLKSWAVPKGPSLDPADKRMAVEVEDHPFDYASFEGVIPPKQYGAGRVIVWDCGVYSPDEGQQYSFGDRAEAQERVRDGLARGKLSFFLRGEKLKGSFALVRTSTDQQWLLIKHKDRFADPENPLANHRSVLSGITLDDLSRPAQPPPRREATRLAPEGPLESMPEQIAPMLAESATVPRSDPDWLFEPKFDGYRVIAFVQDKQVRLQSRRGLDLTSMFPEVVTDLAAQAVDRMILDGEIVALGRDGRPSFNALQNRAQLKVQREIASARRDTPAVLICFDLLHFGGVNLRGAPYIDRRLYLSQCLLPTGHLQLVHAGEDAARLYSAAIANGFEGIVAKRRNSTYQPGRRSPAWLKLRAIHTAEFLVGGYTKGKGEREPMGALLLGYRENGELRYAGHVGSGLTAGVIAELKRQLGHLERKDSPFAARPPLHRPTTWLNPELIAEVQFIGWTPASLLRAPVFVRFRTDVPVEDVAKPKPVVERGSVRSAGSLTTPSNEIQAVLEQLDSTANRIDLQVLGTRIRLTNLDREYWPADPATQQPAVTKRDFIRYLAAVSPYMLPHLRDRPLTMIRMPEGIHGERFFQKHWEQALPDFVESVTVYSEHKEERHRYLLANSLPTLLWLGQNGTLEFHIWHSRAALGTDAVSQSTDYAGPLQALENSVLNYPDYLVFDLDPYIYSGREAKGEEPEFNPRAFEVGRKVAFWLRSVLREMSLETIVKTSGKTGLHVFVPIQRTVTFDTARQICERVGRHIMKAHPKDITLEWSVPKRTGKIFIDYNMNVRGKTLNVAYSPRGLPGAPVSMPLTWEELESAEPLDFTIRNVPERLERTGDRWHHALSTKQNLDKAFGRISRNGGGTN